MDKIEPKILKGTRDFLPLDMAKRNAVLEKIVKVFINFGYDAIETPIINPAEIILGKYGQENEKLTYNFKDQGARHIALPFDLTVPFARFVASNWHNLSMPFKRYQIQRVWRAEKPQKGRLREFYQCDIDIIGSKNLLCEAEIAKVIERVFSLLGIQKFKIKVNTRRLINTILDDFNIVVDKKIEVIRVIDKLLKIGEQKVLDEIKLLGVDNAKDILELLKPGASNKDTINKLKKYDTCEIEKFLEFCSYFGIQEEHLEFDPSLARGLDYYTGIIYEVVSSDASFGTLCAGGRYDNLCGLFSNENFSGVGVAFGFERIMILLDQLGLCNDARLNSEVLVTVFDEERISDALTIYTELINSGIKSEIYFEPGKLSKQFKYADNKKIKFVIIRGPDEIARNLVTIKALTTGEQKTIPRDKLLESIQLIT
jgi:histidyl-tRNA synthetase